MHQAILDTSPRVHPHSSNLLNQTIINIGPEFQSLEEETDIIVGGVFETQRIEHAFLEVESAVAAYHNKHLHYSFEYALDE